MYRIYALLYPRKFFCIASASSALTIMAQREGEGPGNIIRAHILDFREVLTKIEETDIFLFQAELLNISQIPMKSCHNQPNPF